ncbi:MAG: hypothetical protein IPG45_38715 [Deltaproteobacteria bacterium]|nr:hypothetical protein [Deltaproteobacteria bacterium]
MPSRRWFVRSLFWAGPLWAAWACGEGGALPRLPLSPPQLSPLLQAELVDASPRFVRVLKGPELGPLIQSAVTISAPDNSLRQTLITDQDGVVWLPPELEALDRVDVHLELLSGQRGWLGLPRGSYTLAVDSVRPHPGSLNPEYEGEVGANFSEKPEAPFNLAFQPLSRTGTVVEVSARWTSPLVSVTHRPVLFGVFMASTGGFREVEGRLVPEDWAQVFAMGVVVEERVAFPPTYPIAELRPVDHGRLRLEVPAEVRAQATGLELRAELQLFHGLERSPDHLVGPWAVVGPDQAALRLDVPALGAPWTIAPWLWIKGGPVRQEAAPLKLAEDRYRARPFLLPRATGPGPRRANLLAPRDPRAHLSHINYTGPGGAYGAWVFDDRRELRAPELLELEAADPEWAQGRWGATDLQLEPGLPFPWNSAVEPAVVARTSGPY